MKTNTKTIIKITDLEFSREEVEFLKSLSDKVSEISVYSNYSEDDMLVEIINGVVYGSRDPEKPVTINVEDYYREF